MDDGIITEPLAILRLYVTSSKRMSSSWVLHEKVVKSRREFHYSCRIKSDMLAPNKVTINEGGTIDYISELL